jgi:tetratricopeptide (TPR) repeat protein
MLLVLLLSSISRAAADGAPQTPLAPLSAKANQLRMRGLQSAQSKQYTQAIAHLTAAIELEPKHVRLYVDRGLVFRLNGELDKAIADYSEVIRLGYDVHPDRGDAYVAIGNYRAAEADYEAALDREDKQWVLFRCRVASSRGYLRRAQTMNFAMASALSTWRRRPVRSPTGRSLGQSTRLPLLAPKRAISKQRRNGKCAR